MTAKPAGSQVDTMLAKPESGGGQRSDKRSYDVLAGKLRALEHDIEAARARTRVSVDGCVLSSRPTPKATARLEGESVRLADGAQILVRPVEPDDARGLELALQRLGALSRYEHLLADVDHLDQRRVADATEVDHRTREVLMALDAATGEGVGLARYLCDPDDPSQAEIACAVSDLWQGRGVGTALAERLAARALHNGVERLTARMFVGNERGRRLLRHVAEIVSEERDGGTVRHHRAASARGQRLDPARHRLR